MKLNENIEKILDKKKVSRNDARILSNWLTKETGIKDDNCFCSSQSRKQKQIEVINYINGNK